MQVVENQLPANSVILSEDELSFSSDLAKGCSMIHLADRLGVTRQTLRKRLKHKSDLQWAIERDPDQLGWEFEVSLELFYPLQFNIDGTIYKVRPKKILESQHRLQEFLKSTYIDKSLHESGEYNREGISQRQVSKITGIPENTIQYWKKNPDFSSKVDRQTNGKYNFSYCPRTKKFYKQKNFAISVRRKSSIKIVFV